MRADAIMVEVSPEELVESSPGVVDVFAALGRQFFWADVVMVAAKDSETDILDGEIVFSPR
ncbi:MAG TPA: hypothetical protein VGL44_13815 [Gaiellales bacterium]|jgi:hypothetical protein